MGSSRGWRWLAVARASEQASKPLLCQSTAETVKWITIFLQSLSNVDDDEKLVPSPSSGAIAVRRGGVLAAAAAAADADAAATGCATAVGVPPCAPPPPAATAAALLTADAAAVFASVAACENQTHNVFLRGQRSTFLCKKLICQDRIQANTKAR